MNKCKCELCQCETRQDYLEWFYKQVGLALKEGAPDGMTFKQYIDYLYSGLCERLNEKR